MSTIARTALSAPTVFLSPAEVYVFIWGLIAYGVWSVFDVQPGESGKLKLITAKKEAAPSQQGTRQVLVQAGTGR